MPSRHAPAGTTSATAILSTLRSLPRRPRTPALTTSAPLARPSLARTSWLARAASSTPRRAARVTATTRLATLPQGTIALAPLVPDGEVAARRRRRGVKATKDGDEKNGDEKKNENERGNEIGKENERKDGTSISPSPPSPAYPTVVLQARENMARFHNCVLLTRVGGFYELYFAHAEEFGPLLNLKVAQKKTAAGPVPMAGFPFFQLDRFLKVLVQDLNQYVAIADEFPHDAPDKVRAGGLMHDRRVARVITPGTLIDENFMDPWANNYVLAIHAEPPSGDELQLGLAWLDLSTGSFFTEAASIAALSSIMARIAPREVILDEMSKVHDNGVAPVLSDGRYLVTYTTPGDVLPMERWGDMLEADIPPATAAEFTRHEVAAGSMLLEYVKTRLQSASMKLLPPQRHQAMEVMEIDRNSMRALEITETIRDGFFKGSLLHTMRRTVTKSGTRLLTNWLTAPSTSLDVINARLDRVQHMLHHEALRERIVLLLRRSHDSQRLVQKFALGRGDPDDMIALAHTIDATREMVSVLRESPDAHCLEALIEQLTLDGPEELARRVRDAIDEDGVVLHHRMEDGAAQEMMALAAEVVTAEGTQEDASVLPKTPRKRKPTTVREFYDDDADAWIMKPAASPALAALHAELAALYADKSQLSEQLRDELSAPSLTLRWTPNLGHICHTKGKDARAATTFRSVQSSKTTRSLHHPAWTQLGQRIMQTKLRIRADEQRVFHELRAAVIANLVRLRRNAAVLDQLDIACAFAVLARDHAWIRPQLHAGTTTTIIAGRHPTVEQSLRERGRSFVANDCVLGPGPPATEPTTSATGSERVWLITGPNMAGKSTFLRQTALITLLAQVGSYVPAAHAALGVADALFSRVGLAADNTAGDESTFMVEMVETARILRRATRRSLVVMDEIGRGTAPDDGAAVAFAALHHLVRATRARALFATHFHAVADWVAAGRVPAGTVACYCTDVRESAADGGFSFDRRLRPGVNYNSHALRVARLAGLPEEVIAVADGILRDVYHRDDLKGRRAAAAAAVS